MINLEPKELSKIINDLDRLLIESHYKKRRLVEEYQTVKDSQDFDLKKFISKIDADLDDWYKKVVDILQSLNQKRYLFHFIKTKDLSMVKMGMPMEHY